MANVLISVVVPFYRCSKTAIELTAQLEHTLNQIGGGFELIYVNDASPENDWDIIKQLALEKPHVKAINFSRNFGQHYAIYAGLCHASGDWVVVMDGDLQDQPKEITKLWNQAQKGFDVVLAQRVERHDSFIKVASSKLFYKLFSYLTDTKQDPTVANFGIYHKKVIAEVVKLGDSVKYFPVMVQWVGFNRTKIAVEHSERKEGKSSYSFSRLIQLAFTIIIAFSDKLLKLTVKLGFIISVLSIVMAGFFLYRYFTGSITQMGWTSLILSIWFLSGITISILGILGLYMARIFEKVKNRPVFIIKDAINL